MRDLGPGTDGTRRRGCCGGRAVAWTGRSPLPSRSESPPGSDGEEHGFPQLTQPRCDSQRGESGQDQALSSHPWGPAAALAPRGACQVPRAALRRFRFASRTLRPETGCQRPGPYAPLVAARVGLWARQPRQARAGLPAALGLPRARRDPGTAVRPRLHEQRAGLRRAHPGGALQAPASPSCPPDAGRHLRSPAAAAAAASPDAGG